MLFRRNRTYSRRGTSSMTEKSEGDFPSSAASGALYAIEDPGRQGIELAPGGAPNPVYAASLRQRTIMQKALERIGVTPGWIAERCKENALAFKPVVYCGQITRWVPDSSARVKAMDQLLRLAGHYAETQQAGNISLELSIDDRRKIQVKAAARLASWGLPYHEEPEEQGEGSFGGE